MSDKQATPTPFERVVDEMENEVLPDWFDDWARMKTKLSKSNALRLLTVGALLRVGDQLEAIATRLDDLGARHLEAQEQWFAERLDADPAARQLLKDQAQRFQRFAEEGQ
jgi:hypothetical protein